MTLYFEENEEKCILALRVTISCCSTSSKVRSQQEKEQTSLSGLPIWTISRPAPFVMAVHISPAPLLTIGWSKCITYANFGKPTWPPCSWPIRRAVSKSHSIWITKYEQMFCVASLSYAQILVKQETYVMKCNILFVLFFLMHCLQRVKARRIDGFFRFDI